MQSVYEPTLVLMVPSAVTSRWVSDTTALELVAAIGSTSAATAGAGAGPAGACAGRG